MERSEIEEKYKWKTEDIYPSDEAWEKAFAEIKGKIDFSKFKGTLKNAESLLKFYKYQEEIYSVLEKLFGYASLKHDEDVRVQKYVAYTAQMSSLFAEIGAQSAFVDPELLKLPEGTLESFIADPRLKDYDYTLQRLVDLKSHVLSEAEENILALSGEAVSAYSNIFGMINNAELDLPECEFNGKKIQMTHGLYGVVMHSGTREERRAWFKALYGAYIKKINTLTETYGGNVKKDVFYARARKYNSCLEMSLAGSDVPVCVYDNLIKTVHGALKNMHKYIALRKDILGIDEQHMYDVYAPIVTDAEISMEYDEAYDLVIKGLAPLGEDYQRLLKKAHDERWIDVYENTGKTSGAYSSFGGGVHPFVLLNYTKTLNDIFTIAHEMGHSIHTYKSHEAQPFYKTSYTLFVAEIASTCNEVLLLKYLYNNAKDVTLKKYLLNYYMDMIRATLFRQTQFAEFEQIVHEKAEAGVPLTKDFLCETYYNLNKQYYGDGIVHDEEIAYEWSRIPHFYRSFYVYQYSTGIISAISIAKRILEKGESAVQDYFKFLSSGGSMPPVEELKLAGVDLTTMTPFEVAMKEFEDTIEEFKKLS